MSFLYKDIIYDFSLYNLIWYFLVYSFLGWCMEVCYAAFKTKKFINRGFLNGTYCPLYGAGACVVLVLLNPVQDHPFLIFLLSSLITTTIEFLTGLILELLYHKKWWDYSERKFNIKGYVCLEFSVIWGVCCLLVYDILHPIVRWPINHISHSVGIWIAAIWLLDFIIDVIVSTIQATRFAKYVTRIKENQKRGSDAIGEKLAGATIKIMDSATEVYEKYEIKRSSKRLLKAFPTMRDNRDKSIIAILRERALIKKQKKAIKEFKEYKNNKGAN